MRFSIWEGEGITLVEGVDPPRYQDGTVQDAMAKCVYVFEAGSWEEACKIQHVYYDWEPYKPPDEDETPASNRGG